MNDKILTLLGFASKSGNISFGMDAAKESLKKGKSKLILIACDISEKSIKEIRFFSEKKQVVTVLTDYSVNTFSSATGHKGGILSVNDKGFADAIRGGITNGKN